MVARTPPAAAARPSPQSWRPWQRWLLLGAAAGVGFGVTQRLLALDVGLGWIASRPFGVVSFPGEGLEVLRRRHGAEGQAIRADLELLEQERHQQREEQEMARQQADLERRQQQEQERQLREQEQVLSPVDGAPTVTEPQPLTAEPRPQTPIPAAPEPPRPPAPARP